jgi:hypothetical protein
MGKSAPSAPAAPDPAQTAAAQGAINKETAITQAQLNRNNQYTPYGQSIWTKSGGGFDQQAWADDMARWNSGSGHGGLTSDPTLRKNDYQLTPEYTQTVTLSPEQQRLYDLQNQAQQKLGVTANEQLGRLQSSLATPLNYDGLPEQVYKIGDYAADRSRVEDALLQRMNPQLDRDQAALEQRLANQGIALGSQAYGTAMQQAAQQRNDARYGAINQAGSEQQRLIQQAMAQAAMQNQARQQGIQERTSLRTQPLNEISALMSGSQVTNPQFASTPQVQVQPADYQGAANLQYQGQLAQYNAANQANQGMMGGLFGLGGAALGNSGVTGAIGSAIGALPFFSDIRLKRDIVKTGTWRGFNKYLFRYLWDDAVYEGVMAQEVEKTRPDAVKEVGGFKTVNYAVL